MGKGWAKRRLPAKKAESKKASNKKAKKGSVKINVKDVALATAIIVAMGACGYTVYNEAFGNKIVKSSRGSACASSSI